MITSENIERNPELVTLTPAYLLGETSCYLLWDEHPLDPKPIDVVIGTKKCEIIELSSRQVVSSIQLEDGLIPRDIKLFRDKKNNRFYIVSNFENLFIISTENNLKIFKRLNNVKRYEINDKNLSGTACLTVWYMDDAVPVTLNENFECNLEFCEDEAQPDTESTLLSSLRSKLMESKYTVTVNESRLQDLQNFRQRAMYTILQDMCPNSEESSFKTCEVIHKALKLENLKPWCKLCNKKVVLGVNFTISHDGKVSNIKFLLQSNTNSSITYKDAVFSSIPFAPYWKKINNSDIETKSNYAIVAITNIEEFSVENYIQYLGLISYEMNGKEKFMPLQEIKLSCLETMNESFDVLSLSSFDEISFLSVLCTTVPLKLKIHNFFTSKEDKISDMAKIFETHLGMELLSDNIVAHKSSPYHVLNGVMIIFEDCESSQNSTVHSITVYLRNKSQLSSLVHLIADGIPHRLIVTPFNVETKPKELCSKIESSPDLMEVDDDIDEKEICQLIKFGESLLRQTNMVLEYFDECIKVMAENKNAEVGTKIDILAPGERDYSDFYQTLNEEIKRSSLLF